MDSFVDKFAQRANAQEIIKANSMAEAKENERLSAQVAGYDSIMQDIRKLNLQNIENAEKVREVLNESIEKIREIQKAEPGESKLDVEAMKEVLDETRKASDDFQHKEAVKVYRNVQAVIEDIIPKQTAEIQEMIQEEKASGSVSRALLPIAVITMLATLANTVILVLRILGII